MYPTPLLHTVFSAQDYDMVLKILGHIIHFTVFHGSEDWPGIILFSSILPVESSLVPFAR
ncbi:hypothetical protein CS542_08920 [Pedobacter sp. IW39]|nr:hypothetical protein CS542_08920 [Pedobacter sp. IW39]